MSRKLTLLSGVLFFAALVASIVLDGNAPDSHTVSGAKVIAFYTAHRDRMIASAGVLVVGVFFGVVFYGALRDHLRGGGGAGGLAATAFGGALLYAGSGCVGAGAALALTDKTSLITPSSAQTLSLLRTDVNTPLAAAGSAILLFAFGLAILKGRLLPRWLGWSALPFAVVGLVPGITFAAAFFVAVWTLIASIVLYRRLAEADTASLSQAATAR